MQPETTHAPEAGTARGQDSWEARRGREQQKAIEKYGEIALRPSGHPDYDVLDYAINEIVGLARYGEMVFHRVVEMVEAGHLTAGAIVAAGGTRSDMTQKSIEWSRQLIALRTALLQAGADLGRAEVR